MVGNYSLRVVCIAAASAKPGQLAQWSITMRKNRLQYDDRMCPRMSDEPQEQPEQGGEQPEEGNKA
jgi:hypothetical protein